MSPLLVLFIENFLYGCALNSGSLLPPYLSSLGAGQGFIGLFNILGTLATVVAVVFFGKPLVRLPRVRALKWGFAVMAVSLILSWVFATSLLWVAVFRVLGSVAQVFGSTLLVSLVIDHAPAESRTSSLAIFSLGGMLTNPVSAVAGETILGIWGGPGLYLMGAIFALAALVWTFFLREPPTQPHPESPLSFRQIVLQKDMRPLLILAFGFGVFYSAITTFLPHQTQTALGTANLSAFVVPFSLVSVVVRLSLGKQLDRRAPRRFLHASFTAVTIAMGCLLLPSAWVWIILAGLLYGLGHSILYPLLNSLFVQKGSGAQRAVYSNVYMVATLVGPAVMTPILGTAADLWGFPAVPAVLGSMALASVFLVRGCFPRPGEGRPSGHNS